MTQTGNWWEPFTGDASSAFTRLLAWLPSLGAALLVSGIGWAVGRLVRRALIRALELAEERIRTKTDWMANSSLEEGARLRRFLGSFAFWLVFLTFTTAAVDTLDIPIFSDGMRALVERMPFILLAAALLLGGVLVGRLAGSAVTTAAATAGTAPAQARLLGRVAQIAIVVAAAITAVDQVGIESGFLTGALLIALGALFGGGALAFGMGARTVAANVIAIHYFRQRYRVGQTIRIDGIEGAIVDIGTTEVVLENDGALIQVPGDHFSRCPVTILREES